MPLIKCIDCGEMISDRSEYCVKCGCPTSESIRANEENEFYIKINDKFYDLSEYKDVNESNENKYSGQIKRMAEIAYYDSDKILEDIMNNSLKPEYTFKHKPYNPQTRSQLRCPKCGSTSITTGQKGFTLTTGFLGSNKTVNRCGSCGHSWKPR